MCVCVCVCVCVEVFCFCVHERVGKQACMCTKLISVLVGCLERFLWPKVICITQVLTAQ